MFCKLFAPLAFNKTVQTRFFRFLYIYMLENFNVLLLPNKNS